MALEISIERPLGVDGKRPARRQGARYLGYVAREDIDSELVHVPVHVSGIHRAER